MADVILDGAPMVGADLEDGIASVRGMVAIARSVETGRPVALADAEGAGLMQLGIFAKTFDTTGALPTLQAVAGAGYATAQFNLACLGLPSMPDAIPPGVAAEIAAAAAATGVSIAAVSGTYNMIHPDPAVRAAGLRRLEVLAAACRPMGTRLVTLCTGTRDPDDQWRWHPDNARPQAWRDLRAEMDKAVAIAERFDLALGDRARARQRRRRRRGGPAAPRRDRRARGSASCSTPPTSSSRRTPPSAAAWWKRPPAPSATRSPWPTPRTAPPTAASPPPARA